MPVPYSFAFHVDARERAAEDTYRTTIGPDDAKDAKERWNPCAEAHV